MEAVATPAATPPAAPATAVSNKRPRDDAVESLPYQGRQNSFHNNNHNNNTKRQRKRKPNHHKRPPSPPPPAVCSVCSVNDESKSNDKSNGEVQSPTTTTTKKDPPKYKCPKCRALYCSVACCRTHKESCPGKPPEETVVIAANAPIHANNNDSDSDSDSDDDDESVEEGWKITDEMKQALQKSSWLHQELKDGGLRDTISQVVRASKKKSPPPRRHYHNNRRNVASMAAATTVHNPAHDALLEKRSDNPHFNIFCDKLLVLAGVLERQGDNHERDAGMMGTAAAAAAANQSSPAPHSNNAPRDERELEQWLKQTWEPDQPPPMLSLKPIRKKAVPTFEPIDLSSSSEEEESDDSDESSKDSGEDDSSASGTSSSKEGNHDDEKV